MRLTTVVVFGAGYVMGTKAGRERYAQIVAMAETASKRLDEFSARTHADARSVADGGGNRDSGRHEAAL